MEELDETTFDPEQLIAFIQHVLECEYAALVANYTERDDQRFAEAYRSLQRYIHGDLDLGCHRPTPVTADWLQYNASLGARVRRRTLFAIRTYSHPDVATVVRADVGPWNDWLPEGSYAASYFFAFFDGKLRLFSIYDRDTYPERQGHRLREPGLAWVWGSGSELPQLGEPVSRIPVKPPTEEASRQVYAGSESAVMEELDEATFGPGELIAFIQHVLECEYAALVASDTERDDQTFSQAYRSLQHYLHGDLDLGCHRPTPVTADWLQGQAKIAKKVRRRTLFAICTYDHPDMADVFRAYVGPRDDQQPEGSYAASYFFAFFDGKLRLFSIYDRDRSPERQGHRLRDSVLGWVWKTGSELHPLGEPVFLIPVEPPTEEASRQAYQRIE